MDAARSALRNSRSPELVVTLHDQTHLVTGLFAIEPPTAGEFPRDGVVRFDGQPDAVRVSWTGGACESGATAIFLATEHGYGLAMRANKTLLGLLGCAAVGIPRSLVIRFKEPIAHNTISLWPPRG